MTDADGYFSPRNHPQRIVYISDDSDSDLDPEISDSEMEPIGERTPLFRPPTDNSKRSGPSLPSPPYNHSTTTYGSTPTGRIMGGGDRSFNDAIEEEDAAPPYYSADHAQQHVCTENCNCGAGESAQAVPEDKGWRRPDIIRDPWGTFERIRKENSTSEICSWIFIRIAFVLLASFLLTGMFTMKRHGHGGGPPGRPYPGPPPDEPGRKVWAHVIWMVSYYTDTVSVLFSGRILMHALLGRGMISSSRRNMYFLARVRLPFRRYQHRIPKLGITAGIFRCLAMCSCRASRT